MKRRTTFLGLLLALAMVFTSFSVAFAAEPEYVDPASIDRTNIQTITKKGIENEADFEAFTYTFNQEVKAGKYNLISSEKLMSWVNGGKDMVLIDTMPAGWFSGQHIPGAINVECGDNGPNGNFTAAQQKALLKAVKAACGTKKVKYYYNSKKKKWVTKKPAAKYWKGKKTKYKNVAIKNKPIVTYCGFVGCNRSHTAAAYLVSQGYTKVYRYSGGISAWADKAMVDPDNYKIVK